MRYVLALAAFASLFFFPYPATVILALLASLYFPPIALFVGIFTDLLYYTPGASSWPIASLIGLLSSVIAFFVRRFMKARIMGGW